VLKLLFAAAVGLVLAGVLSSAHAGSRRCAFPEGQEYQHCYQGYDYQFWERDYRSRRGCDDCGYEYDDR